MRGWGAIGALMLALMPASAMAEWTEAKSKHFTVYSDGTPKQLMDFADDLERFDFLLRLMTGVSRDPAQDTGAPVRIWLLPNDGAVKAATGNPNIAGLYFPSNRGGVAIASRERASNRFDLDGKVILFHEYTHHFMLHYFPSGYPTWYVEGFAEYFSTATFAGAGQMDLGRPPLGRAVNLVLSGTFPLDQLTARATTGGMNLSQGDRFYGTAWLLTHFFENRPERKKQFQAYLSDVAAGKADVKFADYFGGSLDPLEKEMRTYLQRPLRFRRMELKAPLATQIVLRNMSDDENAVIKSEMQYLLDKDENSAPPKYLPDLRALAARFPNSAYVQSLLSDVERSSGNKAQATEAADRAVAADPNYARALSAKAELLIEKAAASGTDADWNAARDMVVRANRADTEDPVPLKQYFRYTAERGRGIPTVAYDGLWKAFGLVPQDPGIRFMLASALANKGDYDQAARLMDPLANSPHDSSIRQSAISMREALMQAKAKGEKMTLELGEE